MDKIKLSFAFLFVLAITGCSHPIQVSPDLSVIDMNNKNKSHNNAGYYISASDLAAEVTTPGGGGDSVKYFPYKDTEAAVKTILSQKFNKVYSLSSQANDPLIEEKGIKFIFIPKIKTNSSSSSVFTWPPTDFTMELTCNAYSKDGKNIWSKTVTGNGHAEFSEFTSNFSLSAKRASEQAFTRMRDEILNAKILN